MCFLVKFRDENNALRTEKGRRIEKGGKFITLHCKPEQECEYREFCGARGARIKNDRIVEILDIDSQLSAELLENKVALEEYVKMALPLYR